MKNAAIITASVVCMILPNLALAIDVVSPLDLSKVEFGSPRDAVLKEFPNFVDHETDSGSAIKRDELHWKEIFLSSIIWFDDRDLLRSVMFLLQPDDLGRVKPSFERLQNALTEIHGEPSATDIREGGYSRFEWALQSSLVSLAFIPGQLRLAEHAILSYRAPKNIKNTESGPRD